MVDKVYEFDTHMRVADRPVHYNRHANAELEMEVDVLTKVRFRVDLFEEFRESIQVVKNKLRKNLKVQWKIAAIFGVDCFFHECKVVVKYCLGQLNFVCCANQQSVCEGEEASVVTDCDLAKNVGIHAQLHRHHVIKVWVVLLAYCFV